MMVVLVLLGFFVVSSLVGLLWLLATGQSTQDPPRHVEDQWSAYGLPNHPYSLNR